MSGSYSNPLSFEKYQTKMGTTDTGFTRIAEIAAGTWNNNDHKHFAGWKNLSDKVPSGFGYLEITGTETKADHPNPTGLASVDVRVDRKKGTMTIKDLDTHETQTINVFSGDKKHGFGIQDGKRVDAGASGKFDNLIDLGPIPKGQYLIGKGVINKKMQEFRPDGDNVWYPLYPTGGNTTNRKGFFIHGGKISHGCVTVPSDVPMSNPKYPHSRQFSQMRRLFDNTWEFTGKTPSQFKTFQLLEAPDLSKNHFIGVLTVD